MSKLIVPGWSNWLAAEREVRLPLDSYLHLFYDVEYINKGRVNTMGENNRYLGEFEEIVLLTVARLGSSAYGVTIRQTVEEVAGRQTSIGAIYTTLERLEQKGYVSSRQGEPTAQRGGRAKRYFQIEGAGRQALHEAERIRTSLRGGLVPDLRGAGGSVC